MRISFLLLKAGVPWDHASMRGTPLNFLKQQSANSVGSKDSKKVSVIKHGREIRGQEEKKQTAARGTFRFIPNSPQMGAVSLANHFMVTFMTYDEPNGGMVAQGQ